MGTSYRPPPPKRDGYGNIIAEPEWQGYTLADLAEYARTGKPVSTVKPGGQGYGLDQVGNADVYQPEAKAPGFDWKRAAGKALAGLATVQPGAGVINVGRGFVGGTQWGDEQDQNDRRNALTESQIANQQSMIDERTLEMVNGPITRAQQALKDQAELDLLRARLRDLENGIGLREGRQPYLIDADKALAEQRRAAADRDRRYVPGQGGGASTPEKQHLGVVERQLDDTRADIGVVERGMPQLGVLSTAADSALARSVGKQLGGLRQRYDSLGTVRDSLAAGVLGSAFAPTPRLGAPAPRTPTRRSPMLQGFGGVPFGEQSAPSTAGPIVQREPVTQQDYDDIVDLYGEDYAAANYVVSLD